MLLFSFLACLNTSMISQTAPKVVRALSKPCMQSLKIQAKKVLHANEVANEKTNVKREETPPNPSKQPNFNVLRNLSVVKDINLCKQANYDKFCNKKGTGENFKDVTLDPFISKESKKK